VHRLIKQSMPPRIYSALDSFHLAAFGMAWAIHKKAAIDISNPDLPGPSRTRRDRKCRRLGEDPERVGGYHGESGRSSGARSKEQGGVEVAEREAATEQV
jgi:hypothetical protein